MRVLLVQATLIQRGAAGRRGAGLVDQITKAVDLVMRALDIAVAEPRYRFLVDNVSVVFWRVARPLQRPGRFPAILAPMRRVADAIRDALGPDDTEWKARFGLGLAQAYDGTDQPDEAISALGERTLLPRSVPRVLVLSSLHALRWHAARSQAPWTRLEVLGPPKQREMCQLRPRFCLPLAAVIPVHPQSGLSHCLTRAAHFC